jgi:DNA polymerase
MGSFIQRVGNFDAWREAARLQLLRKTPPSALIWQSGEDEQQFLFQTAFPTEPAPAGTVRLPRAFVEAAKTVARHRDPNRWSLLYRIAWRIQNENPNLLHIEVDDDIRLLGSMRKAVETDIYKMQAFVRFRRVVPGGAEQFVAWYRPDHHTLDANEQFFTERFGGMRWAILTPEVSMMWDLARVQYGPGVPRSEAPAEDEFEDLWRTYYCSIYNPARRNLDATRAQLPVRRWQDLPETRTIPELVRVSRGRVESMARMQPRAASAFIPGNAGIPALREAVQRCSACELCGLATQAVFGEGGLGEGRLGEGDRRARVVLVGEQPGDEEDRAGRPFVGPAGQVLQAAMDQAGLDRSSVYVTNAVKAFRYEERGKRRIHKTPRPAHIATCRPWLEAEVAAIGPEVIVCMGASAAQSVLGRTAQIKAERGRREERRWGADVIVTYHPSAILRAPDEATKAELYRALVEDLSLYSGPKTF